MSKVEITDQDKQKFEHLFKKKMIDPEQKYVALYGIPTVTEPEPVAVALYGMPVVTEPEPVAVALYGMPTVSTPGINITYEQLEQNISKLKSTIETLKNSWQVETKKNLDIINNSWVGKDCEEYTKNLYNMDSRVNSTIEALELLCSTYEKARDMVKEKQYDVYNIVSNS